MATSPNIDHLLAQEEPLTKDQAWELFLSMYGSCHEMYEKAGGVESIIREMRGEDSVIEPF